MRQGDTLVVPKLDRLARSVPDARAIGDSLAAGGVRLSIGGTGYDPTDPMGTMFVNILATFAEFEVDLLRMGTREGMAIARANGRLRGKAPKLSARQRVHVLALAQAGEHTIAELASCSRSAARRSTARSPEPATTRPDRDDRPRGHAPTAFRAALEASLGTNSGGHPAACAGPSVMRRSSGAEMVVVTGAVIVIVS